MIPDLRPDPDAWQRLAEALKQTGWDRWDLPRINLKPCQHEAAFTGPLYLVNANAPAGTTHDVTVCLTCHAHLAPMETT